MTLLSRFASAGLMTVALGVGSLASAQTSTNPHLSAIPEDSLINYQVQVQDMLTTQGMAGSQHSDVSWATAAMGMEGVGDHQLFRLYPELERVLGSGPDAVESELGINPDGWISVYHQGLVGIVRVDLVSSDQLLAWLDSQGVTLYPHTEQLPGESTLYGLSDPSAPEIRGYLRVDSDTAQFVVAPGGMSVDLLANRLEAASPSLADSGYVSELADRYGFTGSELFWLDNAGLTRALLSQDGHTVSEDLMKFVPDYRAMLRDPVMGVCAAEVMSLAEVTPRLLYGATDLSVNGDALSLDLRGSLEVADETLLQELAALEGQLPRYLSEQTDSLFGFGLAMNVVQLGDTLLTWRDRIVQADWECPGLVEFQAELAQANVAGVMAATGMLQGARGVVMEVFDMDFSAGDELDSLDVLLAIQADNPQRLARMLAESISLPSGFRVPSEGESATLPLPDAPFQVRISGDYLVVYNGTRAAERALSLADEEHVNALLAMGVDLPETLRRLEDLPASMQAQPATGGMSFDGNCEANLFLADQFSQFDRFFVGGRLATDAFGLGVIQSLSAQRGAPLDSVVRPDTYQLEYFEDCEWFEIGQDQLGSDGQASYTEENDTCTLYEERFDWWVEEGALVWAERDGRYRDQCDESFSQWDRLDDTVSCIIVRSYADGGFQCISQDDYGTRYRYQPVN